MEYIIIAIITAICIVSYIVISRKVNKELIEANKDLDKLENHLSELENSFRFINKQNRKREDW